ncbi:MAG: YihY family inner membrane protein [Luteitalea sp.]|nr:YihY family inner membrane protein [Luteitalea sp.]
MMRMIATGSQPESNRRLFDWEVSPLPEHADSSGKAIGRDTHTGHDEPSGTRDKRRHGIARQFLVLATLGPRRLASLLYEAYNEWSADGAARLGAALSYYTLFSVGPLLIVIVGTVGLIFGEAAARGEIEPLLTDMAGAEAARAVQEILKQGASRSGGVIASVTGAVTLFWSASFLVNELRQQLDIVWKVRPAAQAATLIGVIAEFFLQRLYAFCLVVGAGLLLVMSVLVNTAVAAAGSYFSAWLPMSELALQAISLSVAFAMSTCVFALIYKALPDAEVAWGDVFVGGAVTALLFGIGGFLIATFVGKAAAGSVYGVAGSVLALLLWVYYSSQVFLFGAELTRVFANRYGGSVVPRRQRPVGFIRGRARA